MRRGTESKDIPFKTVKVRPHKIKLICTLEDIDSNLKNLDENTDVINDLDHWIEEVSENHHDMDRKIKSSMRYSEAIASLASTITEFAPSKKIRSLNECSPKKGSKGSRGIPSPKKSYKSRSSTKKIAFSPDSKY